MNSQSTNQDSDAVIGGYVTLDGEDYYRIANSHLMPDFFMSLVGAGDHWMFISSNGAVTAGRQNADQALFPYGADDQISSARGDNGPTTLVRMTIDGQPHLWEPFAPHSAGADRFRRNLYKNPLGNKLIFEEVNETLGLTFRYRWTFSRRFGFVRTCRLENSGPEPRSLELLDGLKNVLPYGVGSEFLMRYSNLANAYKKSELVPTSNLGLFYLSSIPSDRAEPSEGLKSTTVWQCGLEPDAILLSADQIARFRTGAAWHTEDDVRGKAGAFLLGKSLELAPGAVIEWQMVAELSQDHCSIIALDEWLQQSRDPAGEVADDIRASQQEFLRIVSSADGIQCSSNRQRCNRHLSNTVFNVMRGGVPMENYLIHRDDFIQYVANFNRQTSGQHRAFLTALPDVLDLGELRSRIAAVGDPNLTRLGLECLPLAFSRRHGDPTRPWNHFSIDLQSESGRTNLNYQGNWRDLFQNWEALLISFPEFSTGMICRFVNTTTADGYNPYRITRDGFEWEEPSPEDPWANIGYWGDHQIIYLLKLLEWTREFYPRGLDRLLDAPVFTHANVPYRIKDLEAIKRDPRDTIEFDSELSREIGRRVADIGADGKLLRNQQGEIHFVTLLEKLLTLSLAKLSNFVPDGGIWLNTQRPEWNDANNALVGNGLSMVTACYLHRWFKFLHEWISRDASESFHVSPEVASFFREIAGILRTHADSLGGDLDPQAREEIVTALSQAGSDYRGGLYAGGPSGASAELSREECLELFEMARLHLEASIWHNRRTDGLYHAYNLLDWHAGGIGIEPLYEMLEGQVAALSSNLLSAAESLEVLDALRDSNLYRPDQDSFVLYPDRKLPGFLEKNRIGVEQIDSSPLLQSLLADGDKRIVQRDVRGGVHFNGQFRNSADLRKALDALGDNYSADVREHGPRLVQMFDEIFGHRQFTGRSGTFFAYEGLGSIYWHMVSKLGLAVAECFFSALESGAPPETLASLASHYRSIKHGIGAEKSPAAYGAFPSDPYSHTPEKAGVRQPGMTGQVKEDILARFAEIGVHIEAGCVGIRTGLLDRSEVLDSPGELSFFDLTGNPKTIPIPAGGFGFTLFQVPITYRASDDDAIEVHRPNGESQTVPGLRLDPETSQLLFSRSGEVERITCHLRALRQ